MTSGLVKKTVDVVLGDPRAVAERIEVVLAGQGVAASSKLKGSLVHVEISLLEDYPEESIQASIEQAAADVAASIRSSDERTFNASDAPTTGGLVDAATSKIVDVADKARGAIHDATDRNS
jgi:hypothetical protein